MRFTPVFDLAAGFALLFVALVAFLVAGFAFVAGAFLVVVALVVLGFAAALVLVAVAFCMLLLACKHWRRYGRHTLAAGFLAAGAAAESFLASFTVPEVPVCVSKGDPT